MCNILRPNHNINHNLLYIQRRHTGNLSILFSLSIFEIYDEKVKPLIRLKILLFYHLNLICSLIQIFLFLHLKIRHIFLHTQKKNFFNLCFEQLTFEWNLGHPNPYTNVTFYNNKVQLPWFTVIVMIQQCINLWFF
jgi:hypothetical protein